MVVMVTAWRFLQIVRTDLLHNSIIFKLHLCIYYIYRPWWFWDHCDTRLVLNTFVFGWMLRIFEVLINYQPEPKNNIVFRWHVNRRSLWTNPISSSGSFGLSLPRTFGLLCSLIQHKPQKIPCFLSPVHSTLQKNLMHGFAVKLS